MNKKEVLLGYLAIKENSVVVFVFLVVVSLLIAMGIIALIEKYVLKKRTVAPSFNFVLNNSVF